MTKQNWTESNPVYDISIVHCQQCMYECFVFYISILFYVFTHVFILCHIVRMLVSALAVIYLFNVLALLDYYIVRKVNDDVQLCLLGVFFFCIVILWWPISVATLPKTFRQTESDQHHYGFDFNRINFICINSFNPSFSFSVFCFLFLYFHDLHIHLFIYFTLGENSVVVILSINCSLAICRQKHEIIIASKVKW